MSSAIWNWVAVLEGLRPAGETFVPLYWAAPARLFLWLGGTPPAPETVFAVLTALTLVAVGLFIWKRSQVWLVLACLVWGALLADTPYALVLPFAVWFACVFFRQAQYVVRRLLARLFPRRFERVHPATALRTPWGRAFFFGVLGFFLAVAANFVRHELGYPRGYIRQAVASVRWDGLPWSRGAARMDALLDDYVRELARAGEGHRWIFTDGLCDSGIEIASHGRLRAVSMVGGAIDAAAARRAGFTRREDLFSLSTGAAQLLRAWAVDRPAELTNAVYQCGFGFLEQVAGSRIEPCGLVMKAVPADAGPRPRQSEEGADAEERGRGPASTVRALGERIVGFRKAGGRDEGVGRLRSVRFGAMQWRVARAIRREAQLLDRAGRMDEARAAVALSERLDELNPFARMAGVENDPSDSRAFNSLSPREGLSFALKRADFSLARRYAKPILADEPGNAPANFALAMGHFKMKEYALARDFFEKALAARPDDPTLLNNLAMTLLELGELDAARAKAAAALEKKPGSPAIRETLRQIDARRPD